MISQTVEYALRAVLTLAQNKSEPCTSRKIAEIAQIPSAYLSKVMQGLVRQGLVHSQRGLHGGFTLVRDPKDLTIWDVVDAVEPLKRIERCPLDLQSHKMTLCPLHQRLDSALAVIETMFRETKLSELLSEPGNISPLCENQPLVSLSPPRSKKK